MHAVLELRFRFVIGGRSAPFGRDSIPIVDTHRAAGVEQTNSQQLKREIEWI